MEWFAGIARAVFAQAPFTVATIGDDPSTLDDDELRRWQNGEIPETRWQAFCSAA